MVPIALCITHFIYQTFINIKETVFISGQTVVYASSRLLSVWCCCIAGVCTAFDAPIRPYSWQQYVPLTQCLYQPMGMQESIYRNYREC